MILRAFRRLRQGSVWPALGGSAAGELKMTTIAVPQGLVAGDPAPIDALAMAAEPRKPRVVRFLEAVDALHLRGRTVTRTRDNSFASRAGGREAKEPRGQSAPRTQTQGP